MVIGLFNSNFLIAHKVKQKVFASISICVYLKIKWKANRTGKEKKFNFEQRYRHSLEKNLCTYKIKPTKYIDIDFYRYRYSRILKLMKKNFNSPELNILIFYLFSVYSILRALTFRPQNQFVINVEKFTR